METLSVKKIFFVLVLSTLSIYGQGNIKGIVTDSVTADRLKGTKVILTGTYFSTVSDVDGEFNLTGIPAGEYLLQTSFMGYQEKKYLVHVKTDETLKLDIMLLSDQAYGNEGTLPLQAGIQAEESNLQIRSTAITNIIAGKKLKDMPDENIELALSRLPGVTIFNKPVKFNYTTSKSLSSGDNSLGIITPPQDNFLQADDPVSKIFIRGLDSKYSNITVDGIRILSTSAKDESVNLSIISGRNFQNIELHKTITSDEDADATAGAIYITTGKAPDKRMIKADLLGNYNKFDKSKDQFYFTGSYGERFFNNIIGVQIDANIDRKILSSEIHDHSFFFQDRFFSYMNTKRERYVANILLDFNTPDGGSVKLSSFFNQSNTDYFESRVDSTIRFFGSGTTYSNKETEEGIFLSSIKGTNYLLGFSIDWNASFSESRTDHPFFYSLNFKLPFGPWGPQWFPFEEYHLENTIDNPSKNYSKERAFLINIYKEYHLTGEISGEIKFGGKYRVNSKSFHEELYAENSSLFPKYQFRKFADGSMVKKDFSGTKFDGLVGKSKNDILFTYFLNNPSSRRSLFDQFVVPLISKDALRLWRQLNYSEYYLNDGADINSYNFSENISAGYVMHHLNFGQLAKFITGIRIEIEDDSFSGYYYNKALSTSEELYNGIPKQTNTYHYKKTTLLPNFQMILQPVDFLNLRMSVYKTLMRPDYYARAPRVIGLVISGITNNHIPAGYYLNIGNPDLKNADVWNYEFQTQFYGKDLGLLSINAFYKGITGMQQEVYGTELLDKISIESLGINWNSYPVAFPFNKPSYFYTYTFLNSKKPTRIWGFEVEHQANFRYLPGLLKNIVLNYNFTFQRSETWTFDVTDIVTGTPQSLITDKKQKFSDMPDFFANVILGYDLEGLSFRISYFYQDGYQVLNSYSYYQTMKERFSRLDIGTRLRVLENISLVLNLNNITNSKEEYLYKYEEAITWMPFQAYRNGFNFDFGIGVEL